jgi:corrinoid protein of di/trimethylamine methyltransferase
VNAGFDYVLAEAGLQSTAAMSGSKTAVAAQYALFDYDETERDWVEQDKSQIHTIADLEAFPWPDPNELDFGKFENYSQLIPPGMKMMGALGKIFNSVWWLMGFQHFAECLIENPTLIEKMFEKVALTQLAVLDRMLEFDEIGAVTHADDLAYSEALLVGPEHLRKYVFPWFTEVVDRIHAKGKIAIFHSDGKLDSVMPDLIACGFDAIHPFEPKAMDIVANKRLYGDKIGIIGNIDLGYTLTRGTPEEVADECKQRIRELGPGGGYSLASSNSIPEYVPYENFMALMETVYEYGTYPIVGETAEEDRSQQETVVEVSTDTQDDIHTENANLNQLMEIVISGKFMEIEAATKEALENGLAPQDIFSQALTPAMTEVGRRMETSEYFIPEVLQSAKAMELAANVLKPLLVESSESNAGTVVLGTVSGDLHDIGKNLVAMMLEGQGFKVIDLGVDVPPQKYVEAVQENNANVVALSALLTTTMMNMQGVIDALAAAGLRDHVKVIVGGAPVQAEFAKEIGADGFALNAAAGASLAHQLVTV